MIEALDPQTRRILAAGLVALAWLALCGLIAGREVLRRRARLRAVADLARGTGEPVLVAFASQTGFAEDLAQATATALTASGTPVTLRDLSAVTANDLTAARRALFLVSTTGEGDAPDPARAFIRDVIGTRPDLSGLKHGVLALGDSSYVQYCAFGRSLDGWLTDCGAQPLFDRVEVDDGDAAALQTWREQLAALTGQGEAVAWTEPAHGAWRLAQRRHLNPGSPGGEAWSVRLEPVEGPVDWSAGDLFELVTETGDATRDYSIASVPADGGVELIVRLVQTEDGRLGLGSGKLCRLAPEGAILQGRARTNRSFHAPESDAPLILVGAGTGLAGLRAHIKARAAQGRHRNWLLFGERTLAHDYLHRDELEAWTASGVLQRLDLAFSRDQAERIYVQDRLRAAADEVLAWVAEGATVLVCGSLEGMSQDVHAALTDILGAPALDALAEAGRYRRDVY